jgi:formate hydrogenlyase transcriptional activator
MPELRPEAEDAALSAWNAELAFRSVVEATADKAGLDFMRHLVKNLAASLGVAYAFVAEFAGAADRVKTIAFWGRDGFLPNVEYRLSGTPCEKVVAGDLCLYRDDVQRLFPADSDLVSLGVRSYLGVPLRGAQGQTLGHLAALDTRAMPGDPRGVAVFRVFANRARVEIERLHAEALLVRAKDDLALRLETTQHELAVAEGSLQLAAGELRALLEINQSTTRHLRREHLFGELARCVKPLLPPTERFGIEVPTGPESLRVHVLALDRPSSSPMIEEFGSAGTVCRWAQEQRRWFVSGAVDELRERFPTTFAVMQREGMESLCALPLLREERSFGALFFMSTARDAYRQIPVALLQRVASAVAVAVDNCFAYEELGRLRDQLERENVYLQEEIQQEHNFGEIVGRSPVLQQVLGLVQTVAATDTTVLILGETGTGKELVARAIHDGSRRRDRPLVKVNCAAISAGLVESELFGHAKGAFTGALERRVGRFEIADGGTIFLDEVGELPLDTQVKLLRVLQEREFEPVGSSQTRRVDVRVIAATNRDLAREVAEGRFRADLYFRLNVLPLQVPALRERAGDVELLVHFFVDRFARELGKRIEGVSREGMQRLLAWHWPGNVRELSNVIERAVVLSRGPILGLGGELDSVPASVESARPAPLPAAAEPTPPGSTLAEVERQHLLEVLERAGWVIEGPRGAARVLGLHPSTLRSRLRKLGLSRMRVAPRMS